MIWFLAAIAILLCLASCKGSAITDSNNNLDDDDSEFISETDNSSSSSSASTKSSSSNSKNIKSCSSSLTTKSSSSSATSSTSSSSKKSSSSSAVKSSSSEYVEKCNTEDAWEYLNPTLTYETITDERDGQKYKTIRIGNQNWMAQNMNYFQNLDKTETLDSSVQFVFTKCGAAGRYYSWKTAMRLDNCDSVKACPDSIEKRQGICPSGWHIPTSKEYQELLDYTGVTDSVSFLSTLTARIKQSPIDWGSENISPIVYSHVLFSSYNTSGFSLVRAGYQYSRTSNMLGPNTREFTYLLTADNKILEFDKEKPVYVRITDLQNSYNKDDYFSIRCIQDAENMGPAPDPITYPASTYNGPYETLTDERDGQTYKAVKIGEDTWMAENLNYESVNSKCYADREENCKKFGRLYPWYEAVGKTFKDCRGGSPATGTDRNSCQYLEAPIQGICPSGWHMPDTFEIQALFKHHYYDSTLYSEDISRFMRSPSDWNVTTDYGTNKFGFAAVPGGSRNEYGVYSGLNAIAKYWSMNGALMPAALIISFSSVIYTNANFFLSTLSEWYYGGMESVRCVKDKEEITDKEEIKNKEE